MGRTDLVDDPRFSTPLERQSRAARIAIEELLADWLATHRVEDAYRALVAADVPAAPVRDIDQVAADPQVRHREMIVEVRNPEPASRCS